VNINTSTLETLMGCLIHNIPPYVCSTITTLANELVLGASAVNQYTTDRRSVELIQFLPDLNKCNLPNGTMVYVSELKTFVVSFNKCWLGLEGRLYSQLTNKKIFTWGSNLGGRLGDGSTINRSNPIHEISGSINWCQITNNGFSMAAVKTSGQLWTWGYNTNGRLGDGTTTNRNSPVREFCSAVDWCFVSSDVCAGSMAAIKTSGQLWTWGAVNGLGDGTIVAKSSPVREFCSATDWCQVSSGMNHVLAVKTSGQLWGWGENSQGRLGIGSSNSSARLSPVREFCSATDWCQASAGTCHSAAVKTNGQIWTWGNNATGRLGDGTTVNRCSPVREFCSATDWCQVSAGLYHTSAVKFNGQLWSWGSNNGSRLGDGTTIDSCSPVREFCSATDWFKVSAGNITTMAVKTSGQLWGWGSGSNGVLGTGATTSVCSPVQEFFRASNWADVRTAIGNTIALTVNRNF
jgi:alpha-tubulin suppressor-like RCC1 family protein